MIRRSLSVVPQSSNSATTLVENGKATKGDAEVKLNVYEAKIIEALQLRAPVKKSLKFFLFTALSWLFQLLYVTIRRWGFLSIYAFRNFLNRLRTYCNWTWNLLSIADNLDSVPVWKSQIESILLQYQTYHHGLSGDSHLLYLLIAGDEVSKILFKTEFEKLLESSDESKRIHHPLYQPDPMGASFIHVAYLYENYDVGRFLVDKCPKQAVTAYDKNSTTVEDIIKDNPELQHLKEKYELPYFGENILHMAIVRRKYEEIKWLLEFFDQRFDKEVTVVNSRTGSDLDLLDKDGVTGEAEKDGVKGTDFYKLLSGSVKGSFFKRELHYGSYPLHFAACSNDVRIFDMVLTYTVKVIGLGAIFLQDFDGNTLLHLCVIHKIPNMYQHVQSKALELLSNDLMSQITDYIFYPPVKDSVYAIHQPQSMKDLTSQKRGQQKPKEAIIKYVRIDCDEKSFIGRQKESETNDDIVPFPIEVDQWIQEISQDNGKSIVDSKYKEPTIKINASKWVESEAHVILGRRLFTVLNKDFLSPLTLSAYGNKASSASDYRRQDPGRKGMLEYLIGKLKRNNWTFGNVEYYNCNLMGVEMPYDPTEYIESDKFAVESNCKSVIQILCELDARDCIEIPEVRDIIEKKWQFFGKSRFFAYSIMNAVVTLLLTFIACLNNFDPNIANSNVPGVLAVDIMYSLAAALMLYQGFDEMLLVFSYGFDYWGFYGGSKAVKGAAQFDKVMLSLILISFTSLTYFKIKIFWSSTLDSDNLSEFNGAKVSLALCIMFSYIHTYFFLSCLQYTGPFVLVLARIIIRKVPFFIGFYMILLVAFACSISLVTNDGTISEAYGIYHMWHVAWNLIKQTVSIQGFREFDAYDSNSAPSDLIWILDLLQTSFNISVVLIMLNLLIALINETFEKLYQEDDALLLFEKYNIMHSMERGILDPVEIAKIRDLYSSSVTSAQILAAEKVNTSVNAAASTARTSNYRYFHSFRKHLNQFHSTETESNRGSDEHVILLIIDPQRDFHELEPRQDGMQITNKTIDFKQSEEKEENSSHIPDVTNNIEGNGVPAVQKTEVTPNDDRTGVDSNTEEYTDSFTPSLAVPNSYADAERVRKMICYHQAQITEIFVTMDTHEKYHIAHPCFWVERSTIKDNSPQQPAHGDDRKGLKVNDGTISREHPKPFIEMVEAVYEPNQLKNPVCVGIKDNNGKVWDVNPKLDPDKYLNPQARRDWAAQYVAELKLRGKSPLTIWPEHCIVGKEETSESGDYLTVKVTEGNSADLLEPSFGHQVYPIIQKGLNFWEDRGMREFYVEEKIVKKISVWEDKVETLRKDKAAVFELKPETEIRDIISFAKDMIVELDRNGVNAARKDSIQIYVNDKLKKFSKVIIAAESGAPSMLHENCKRLCAGLETEFSDLFRKWKKRERNQNARKVVKLEKGTNWKTDTYSVFKAEVVDPQDQKTKFNHFLLNRFKLANKIVICGQASSHCVQYTVKDMIQHWPENELNKIYVLDDGSSPVQGFDLDHFEFYRMCREKKINVCQTTNVFDLIHESTEERRARVRRDEKLKFVDAVSAVVHARRFSQFISKATDD